MHLYMLHVTNVHIILDWHASMDQWPLKLENLHLYADYPQNGHFNKLKHIIIYIRTYFGGWKTKVPGDWTKCHGHQQARNHSGTYMLVHGDGFLCLPVWSGCPVLGEATSPKGEGDRVVVAA